MYNKYAPVARAADVLGQAERGARDDGARRLVDEQLERERAAVHGLLPGAGVGRAPDPGVPVVVRLLCVWVLAGVSGRWGDVPREAREGESIWMLSDVRG